MKVLKILFNVLFLIISLLAFSFTFYSFYLVTFGYNIQSLTYSPFYLFGYLFNFLSALSILFNIKYLVRKNLLNSSINNILKYADLLFSAACIFVLVRGIIVDFNSFISEPANIIIASLIIFIAIIHIIDIVKLKLVPINNIKSNIDDIGTE